MSTVLAFLAALAILIAVHEWGHYRMAVACQVKVLRFSLGFGRVLWSRRMGADGCEFTVCWIPLGGYVRMLDSREAPVEPALLHRAFDQRPLWQRSAIVAAGPLANLVLAVLLYAGASMWGTQEPRALLASAPSGSLAQRAGVRAGDLVRAVQQPSGEWTVVRSMADFHWHLTRAASQSQDLWVELSDASESRTRQIKLNLSTQSVSDLDAAWLRRLGLAAAYAEPVLGDVRPGGPAEAAGLRAGDRVLRVESVAIADAAQLRDIIRQSGSAGSPEAMRWWIERQGQTQEISVRPRQVKGPQGEMMGRIEAVVGTATQQVWVRRDVGEAMGYGLDRTGEVAVLTVRMMVSMLTGQASLRNLSGPLTIADYAGQTAQKGVYAYLTFLALVSVSLGILNLLPLPMLDGGHLMYHLFEWLSGRPVPPVWLERFQRGGFVVLLMLMSVALFNDVARLLGLH